VHGLLGSTVRHSTASAADPPAHQAAAPPALAQPDAYVRHRSRRVRTCGAGREVGQDSSSNDAPTGHFVYAAAEAPHRAPPIVVRFVSRTLPTWAQRGRFCKGSGCSAGARHPRGRPRARAGAAAQALPQAPPQRSLCRSGAVLCQDSDRQGPWRFISSHPTILDVKHSRSRRRRHPARTAAPDLGGIQLEDGPTIAEYNIPREPILHPSCGRGRAEQEHASPPVFSHVYSHLAAFWLNLTLTQLKPIQWIGTLTSLHQIELPKS
jgi:hypothetical protein